jgi:hypothetical protein
MAWNPYPDAAVVVVVLASSVRPNEASGGAVDTPRVDDLWGR